MDTNTNDLDDLVYKTMPKGNSPIVPPFPSMPKPAQTPVAAPAPKPAPMPAPKPMPAPTAPVSSASGMSGVFGGGSSIPMPSSPTPIAQVPKPAPAPAPFHSASGASGSIGGFDMPTGGSKPSHVKAIVISIIVLILLAAGVFAYIKMKKPAPAPVTQTSDTATAPAPKSQIPDEWRQKYFNSAVCADQSVCGDDADPDRDGLTNIQEYQALTDPNNPDSDKDGLSDGDEKNIFNYDPQNGDSSGFAQWPDAKEAETKWNVKSKAFFTDADFTAIAAAVAKYGFHEPTVTTLGPDLVSFYTNFGQSAAPANTNSSSQSAAAGSSSDASSALDRDTQRSDSIKQIGYALLDYKSANGVYPNTQSFTDMITAIKPLIATKAINTVDPKNVAPYVYSYQALTSASDFKIGYYSETQNQAITFKSADIQSMRNKDQASQRDTQRKADLEQISSALELYSSDNADPNTPDAKIYPKAETWKTDIMPNYIASIPTDPSTRKDYSYTVSPNRDSYALQAALENPPTGKKGYLCTQDGCVYY